MDTFMIVLELIVNILLTVAGGIVYIMIWPFTSWEKFRMVSITLLILFGLYFLLAYSIRCIRAFFNF